MPSFWSDLHGRRLRSVGLLHLATSSRVTETHRDGQPTVVLYHQGEDLVGGATIGRASRLAALRALLADRLQQSPVAA